MTAIITLGSTGSRLALSANRHEHIHDAVVFALDSSQSSRRKAVREYPGDGNWQGCNWWVRHVLNNPSRHSEETFVSATAMYRCGLYPVWSDAFFVPYAKNQTHGRKCSFSMRRDTTASAEMEPLLQEIAANFEFIILAAALGETDSGALPTLAKLFMQKGKQVAVFGAAPVSSATATEKQNAEVIRNALEPLSGLTMDIVYPEMLRRRNKGFYPAVDELLVDDKTLVVRSLLEQIILQQSLYRIKPCDRLILGTEELLLSPEYYTCQHGEAFVLLQARGEGGEIFEHRIPDDLKHRYAAFQVGTVATNGYYVANGKTLVNTIKNSEHAIERLIAGHKRVDIVADGQFIDEPYQMLAYISILARCCGRTRVPYRLLLAEPSLLMGKRRCEWFSQLMSLLQRHGICADVITQQDYPQSYSGWDCVEVQRQAISKRLEAWRMT